tara:strand:+ start:1115 stop:1294 length:180 start_codon:yes stop_codon:yes gene_type:complete
MGAGNCSHYIQEELWKAKREYVNLADIVVTVTNLNVMNVIMTSVTTVIVKKKGTYQAVC